MVVFERLPQTLFNGLEKVPTEEEKKLEGTTLRKMLPSRSAEAAARIDSNLPTTFPADICKSKNSFWSKKHLLRSTASHFRLSPRFVVPWRQVSHERAGCSSPLVLLVGVRETFPVVLEKKRRWEETTEVWQPKLQRRRAVSCEGDVM